MQPILFSSLSQLYVLLRPDRPFASIDAARAWVGRFVTWFHLEHRHSALDYLTPNERHDGHGDAILIHRRKVCERARRARPTRWSRGLRRWRAAAEVTLNRPRVGRRREDHAALAA